MDPCSRQDRGSSSASCRGRSWRAQPRQLTAPYRGDASLHPRLQREPGTVIDVSRPLRKDAFAVPRPGQSGVALGRCKSGETYVGRSNGLVEGSRMPAPVQSANSSLLRRRSLILNLNLRCRLRSRLRLTSVRGPFGVRRYFDVTGGTIEGKKLNGKV